MPRENTWQTLPMPLSAPLDTRSRPSDLGPGILRWKLNFAINSSGKLSRRAGFQSLHFGLRSDDEALQANWDHHRQGVTREPFTLLSEITSPDNLRYLFDGNSSRVSWMDNGTSEWHDIITNDEVGARWKIASLREKVVLTNNVDEPRIHTIGDPNPVIPIAGLQAQGVTRAKIAVQYRNVMILMNLTGQDYQSNGATPPVNVPFGPVTNLSNRIQWSDYRDASRWAFSVVAPDSTIAGFKDLDDGEVILNAGELGGVLYIFTDRAIWRMFPQVTQDTIFGFHRWYSEPKNRTACLKYENTVVATGKEFFYLGDNTVYWFNQFSSAPSSPDWLLKASGRMFEGPDRLDADFCESPIGAFIPDSAGASKEVHFYYPRIGGDTGINDYGLVLSFNTDSQTSPYQTGDYVDHGFTAVTAFTHTTGTGLDCKTAPTYVGASGADYSLKSIGGVFYRQMVTLLTGGVTTDIPDVSYALTQQGYYSQLLLRCPFPFDQRDKILRNVILSHDTRDAISDTANQVNLRIGNSYHLADPLEAGPRCAVQWHQIDQKPLQCPDSATADDMVTEGTRPDDQTEWPNQAEQGQHLYLDLKIQSFTGAAPIGSDSAWNDLSLDYLILP